MTRRALGWLAAGVTTYVVLFSFSTLVDWDPDPVLLLPVVMLALTLWLLVGSALGQQPATWGVVNPSVSAARAGRDHRYSTYLRVLEGHYSMARPDDNVQRRLRDLTALVLAQRHGLELADPRVPELLGTDLLAALNGPPRRLSPDRLDALLRRIEEL